MTRILIVEDHADTAECFARLLQFGGYEVEIADSIEAARAVVAARPIDLLLCDVSLPDGDGRKLLRELSGTSRLKGVALSGYGAPDDIRASLDAGFTAHLVKPVDLDDLTSTIAKTVGLP
ncbi:MAG: response regulator [Tepidisphaeraceae bacterium]